MSLLTNIKNRGFKDIVNPKRWIMFLKALFTSKEETEDFQSYIEQIIYRQSFSDCLNCWKNGSCTHCGCKTPDLFYEKEMVCSGGNWVEMLSAKEWEEFKKDSGIKIGIIYGRN